MEVKTKSGFKFDLDERILDDWRVIRALGRADKAPKPEDRLAGIVDLVSLIFGSDEDRLIEHLQSKNDGYVPTEALKEEILSVFTRAKAAKNSQASQA